jgi:hypothetical protein
MTPLMRILYLPTWLRLLMLDCWSSHYFMCCHIAAFAESGFVGLNCTSSYFHLLCNKGLTTIFGILSKLKPSSKQKKVMFSSVLIDS